MTNVVIVSLEPPEAIKLTCVSFFQDTKKHGNIATPSNHDRLATTEKVGPVISAPSENMHPTSASRQSLRNKNYMNGGVAADVGGPESESRKDGEAASSSSLHASNIPHERTSEQFNVAVER